jgi:glycosyltransferase involved in cell wall biosynthesis
MNLYIDCTETYKTKLNTGIQRVVRKVVEYAPGQPMIFDGIGFLPVRADDLNPKGVQVVKRTREWVVNYPVLYPFAKKTFELWLRFKPYLSYLKNRKFYLSFSSSDVILSAGIVYDEAHAQAFQKLRVPVYQIVYDILPITYPQFFPKESVNKFKTVTSYWGNYAEKLYAISKKVAGEVELYFSLQSDYFYLGADFIENRSPTREIGVDEYFLVVGTLEPRKNHIHILKTFLMLWESGSKAKLVFIGRKGWKFEDILLQIDDVLTKFPERFIWLQDCDDETLEAYYARAEAVICASFDEGFGLPLLEALCRRKNVICSDIEVFREIGGKYCKYFSNAQTGDESLTSIIQKADYKINISGFSWPTWNQLVANLVDKVKDDFTNRTVG